MDHRALVAGLTDKERLELTALSDRRGAQGVLGHFSVLGVTGLLVWAEVPGWEIVLVVHGVVLIFLFTLLHETSHQTVFLSPSLNRAVGLLCGVLVVIPPLWFRYFHLAHHRHTHDPLRDPELKAPKPETHWAWLVYVSGLPVWRGQIATLLALAAGRADADYLPRTAHGRVIAEARVMVVLYAGLIIWSIAAGSAVLLWLWVIPALLGQPFLRLYLLAEHGRCPHVANMLENTRTTLTNRVVRWLAWNMPYHAEHHAYPAVPFHKLPQFHAIARAHLKEVEYGYARFNRRYISAIGQDGRRLSRGQA